VSARAIVDQLAEIEHTAGDESEPDPIIAPIDLEFK